MTSDSDDLEQQLRENLKLRAELGAKVANAKQGGGMAYRLGWVLYWICLMLAGGWAAISLWLIRYACRGHSPGSVGCYSPGSVGCSGRAVTAPLRPRSSLPLRPVWRVMDVIFFAKCVTLGEQNEPEMYDCPSPVWL
jgi:hypothetical protein